VRRFVKLPMLGERRPDIFWLGIPLKKEKDEILRILRSRKTVKLNISCYGLVFSSLTYRAVTK